MLLRLINAAGRRFVKNGFTWLRLDEKTLLNKACERTGLDDFGDDSFREGLRVLLRSYELDAEFSFVGRICVNERHGAVAEQPAPAGGGPPAPSGHRG